MSNDKPVTTNEISVSHGENLMHLALKDLIDIAQEFVDEIVDFRHPDALAKYWRRLNAAREAQAIWEKENGYY